MRTTRRHFLATAAAASGSFGIASFAQNVANSGRSLKITGIETFAVKVPSEVGAGSLWFFVKLITNKTGLVGYGEVYTLGIPFGPATLGSMVRDFGARLALGADPYQIEALFQSGYEYGYGHYPDFTRLGILSALEMACWDIVGKDLNKPVYQLLGGSVRNKIRTYSYLSATPAVSSSVPVWRDARASAEAAQYLVSEGYTAVKLDPVLGRDTSRAIAEYEMVYPTEETPDSLHSAEKVVGAIRNAVGDKCDILIGTHSQFTPAVAIRFAKSLEQFDPLWFEEPVPPENMGEMALVARSTTIPICAGERLATKYDFARLLEEKAAAIINFDLGRVGGILEARKIAGMAESHYVQVSPHLYGGPLIAAASFQLDLCCPNFLIQECIGKFGGLHAELLQEPIEWKNGYVVPSSRPGLGYELNETSAKKYALGNE